MQCKSTVTTLTKYHDVWHALHETQDLNVDLWMNAKHDTTQARLKYKLQFPLRESNRFTPSNNLIVVFYLEGPNTDRQIHHPIQGL
ncbi:hypothetical protein A0H81_11009 [Grifola frondosa]|uniref:Uncharacterized protein n=1 Tax=Grifola frondosa TaxID=5627 RepID=A0A1C7LVZ3_GRIFR|nr:hypothetical protein A0H81_11009 [Grifola frondosa]